MADEKDFKCEKCGRKTRAPDAPDCCGEKMAVIPMEACTGPFSAESYRAGDEDGPCDDSRG